MQEKKERKYNLKTFIIIYLVDAPTDGEYKM